ncbi:HAD family hydrolase [Tolumonas osonensis]|uniref:Beta-phosphoglucomutase family hydrolase n=1 Tax=Tolumonas osonensis TaxID=675874 RepID=A0A841GH99_9GAMM|nr:HAD-IA family hydrolase [Tolumonas osonensis]MBB6056957.1 beta-phosphoglucomutase family hydrolase [Tolumonas osonensis]
MFDINAYQKYAAWIFDLDGTISNSLQAHDLAWEHALTQFAIPYTGERMTQLGGVPIPNTVEILAKEAGMQVDVPAVVSMRDQRFYELLPTTLSPTPLVAGVVLPFLGEKPMAVGTGCHTEMARRILAGLSLDHYLPVVVGADQVTNPKPAPDTFLLAAEKLGVKPEHCLVFEDADAGIKAAKAAGMAVVDVREIWTAKKTLQ